MAYSTDLRQKIVRAYDAQLGSQRAIAELFGVSRSFVEKLLARRRSTGEITALPHGGGRQPHCAPRDIALSAAASQRATRCDALRGVSQSPPAAPHFGQLLSDEPLAQAARVAA